MLVETDFFKRLLKNIFLPRKVHMISNYIFNFWEEIKDVPAYLLELTYPFREKEIFNVLEGDSTKK